MAILKAFFERKLHLLILLGLTAFLLSLFPPPLLLSPTSIAGGDTASHLPSAAVMRHRLLSGGPLFAWVPGNYAGFPLFLNYFPLPFILIACLSFLVSLPIAFKVGTLLAVIPLPLAMFGCLRNLGCPHPAPALGAAFSVLFLAMKDNSMWGGNLTSTLAGEFSYGISLILAVYLVGKLFRDVPRRRSLIANAVLEALVAFSSGFPVLQAGFGSFYFLRRLRHWPYLIVLHALAAGMIGFWLLPLVWRLPWSTPAHHTWHFQGWWEAVPVILWPAVFGILLGWGVQAYARLKTPRTPGDPQDGRPQEYLWFQVGVSLLFFACAPWIGLADVRFLPFTQILLLLLGAIGWGEFLNRFPYSRITSCLLVVGVVLGSQPALRETRSWIEWNYSGFEAKELWPVFQQINSALKGTENDPRVFYEHSALNDRLGTARAFEMLPYFSGRSTLEGLYMQSSLSSPFVFYLQSELTQSPSCPFQGYSYSRVDAVRAAQHLRLFNANQVITVTRCVSDLLDQCPDYALQRSIPPYRIYEVSNFEPAYVVAVRYLPHRIPAAGWKATQYEWFRRSSLEVPLVVTPESPDGDYWLQLPLWEGSMEQIPIIPLARAGEVQVTSTLEGDRIRIWTSHLEHPLWIKVSYHPDWHVAEGAGELYAASPAFLLLFPRSHRVTLQFQPRGGVYSIGTTTSLIAWLGSLALVGWSRWKGRVPGTGETGSFFKGGTSRDTRVFGPIPKAGLQDGNGKGSDEVGPFLPAWAWVLLGMSIPAVLFWRGHEDPILLFHRGVKAYDQADAMPAVSGGPPSSDITTGKARFSAARRHFARCLERFPNSPVVDHAFHYFVLTFMKEDRLQTVIDLVQSFLIRYPDSRFRPQALYYSGLSSSGLQWMESARGFYWQVLRQFPEDPVAPSAAARLIELDSPQSMLSAARELYAQDRHLQALPILESLRGSPIPEIRSQAMLLSGYCRFYLSHWEEASRLLPAWLQEFPGHSDTATVLSMLAESRMALGQYPEALESLRQAMALDPSMARSFSGMALLKHLEDLVSISGKAMEP